MTYTGFGTPVDAEWRLRTPRHAPSGSFTPEAAGGTRRWRIPTLL